MGAATNRIELGTAVMPIQTRHPVAMAQQALANQAVCEGRFTLGIGPSHHWIVEDMLGLPYDRPARQVRDYLEVLTVALSGPGQVDVENDSYRVHNAIDVTDITPTPVLVAALAPVMLRIAGELADGTILWMANATAVATHVAPRIRAAARAAGRPEPRIVVGLPVAVHDDVDEARNVAAEQFAIYGTLPNYQRILAHGGLDHPADAAIVGDEAAVTAQIEAIFAAGGTDVWANPFPVGGDRAASRARTRALLQHLATR
jgi:F420-dependent oxidoreductase-like protein